MRNVRSIMVGYDFSACSDAALAQALRIAHRNQAPLRILHVIDSLVIEDLAATSDEPAEEIARETRTHATAALGEALDRIAGDRDRPAELELDVAVGNPIEVFLDRIQEHRVHLLILGAYGSGGAHNQPGTLATRCVRKASALVLLVAETDPGPFRTIVACVDFSETSRSAVEHALRIAARYGGSLHLLHVFSGPWHRMHYRSPTREASPDFQTQYRAALRGRLEQLLEPFAAVAGGVEVHMKLLDRQNHGRGIVEYAHETNADLIVLGTRGRSNLRYVLLGSTAERVLREVTCSLLAIKPDGFLFER